MGRLIAWLSLAGCASPPAAEVVFAETVPDESCLAEEGSWFRDEERVWISAEADTGPIADTCVEGHVASWSALESQLRSEGDLLTDIPVGRAFHLYLVGLKTEPCPGEGGPATPFDFCAFTVEPVTIEREGGADVALERYCQARITWEDCRSFAENLRN